MSYRIEQKFQTLGLVLPPPRPRFNNRLGAKRVASRIYVSGHPSSLRGVVGSDVSVEEAYDAARGLALVCIGTIGSLVDSFDDVLGFNKLTGSVRSAPDFTDQALVVNGASDLIVELFGENGMHARSAIGVAQLARSDRSIIRDFGKLR